MLPWGKQKHLSSAQPWLSLSDKSWGGLCQRCPACHLSPSYTISHTQPLPIHTVHPICTRLPSSWQCDRSRWFTPPLPSGLLCSRPRLAHLCREWEGLSPLANTSGENPVFSKGLEELKSLLQSFPSIRHKKKSCRSDKVDFTKVKNSQSKKKKKKTWRKKKLDDDLNEKNIFGTDFKDVHDYIVNSAASEKHTHCLYLLPDLLLLPLYALLLLLVTEAGGQLPALWPSTVTRSMETVQTHKAVHTHTPTQRRSLGCPGWTGAEVLWKALEGSEGPQAQGHELLQFAEPNLTGWMIRFREEIKPRVQSNQNTCLEYNFHKVP